MGKIKPLNSSRLVILQKELGSDFQDLAAAYLNAFTPHVVALGFGKTNTFVPLKL